MCFSQDSEGNWGYIPSGADSVIPFKKEVVESGISLNITGFCYWAGRGDARVNIKNKGYTKCTFYQTWALSDFSYSLRKGSYTIRYIDGSSSETKIPSIGPVYTLDILENYESIDFNAIVTGSGNGYGALTINVEMI